MTTLED